MKARWLVVAVVVLASGSAAMAQEHGELALGLSWLDTSGSAESFASQYTIDDGVFVESFHLDLTTVLEGYDRFELSAAGFGAEPWQRAALVADWDREWSLRVGYDRRESFFAMPSFDLGVRRDRWAVTRWQGSLTWDGLKPVRLRLDARDVRRSGTVELPFYGLGLAYVGRRDLDERVQELGLSVETKTLPVKIVFTQEIARYLRRSRADVVGDGENALGGDPDLLTALATPGEDENTVPTTRLAVVYRSDRVEVVGAGLYRSDRLDAERNDLTAFGVAGGTFGTIGYLDAVTGSADRDLSRGDLRLGFLITDGLTLRLDSRREESSMDATLLGERILQLSGPGGSIDLPVAVDERGTFDRTDNDTSAELEWRRGAFGLALRYRDGSREVSWKRGEEYVEEGDRRDIQGVGASASFSPSRVFSIEVGWDDADFERFVFRTDPDSVTRLWGKLRARPATGLELAAYASREEAANPAAEAGLDRTISSTGVAATYTAASGAFATLSLDWLDLESDVETAFFAPTASTGLSRYRAELQTATVRAAWPISGAVRLEGGALRVEDRGDSLPFTTSSFDLRVSFAGPLAVDYSLFAQSWSYDLDRSDTDDYEAQRYGLVLRRRF